MVFVLVGYQRNRAARVVSCALSSSSSPSSPPCSSSGTGERRGHGRRGGAPRRKLVLCATSDGNASEGGAGAGPKGESRQSAWQTRQAEEWIRAQQQGLDEDELVAATFGKERKEDLSEMEQQYADKLLAMMQRKVKEVKLRDAEAKKQILIGKRAYAKGDYSGSIPFFESALACTASDTLVGGEAQMWLALALDGSGKMERARVIYLDLKENHPLPSIRNQAGDLLYILEAPKLKIKEEERLKIPDLQEVDQYRNRRAGRSPRPPPRKKAPPKGKNRPPTWEEKFVANSPVLRTFRNRYVQVAFLVISLAVSIFGNQLLNN